jgi:hypothetical protein
VRRQAGKALDGVPADRSVFEPDGDSAAQFRAGVMVGAG